jgi:hypothetical protein
MTKKPIISTDMKKVKRLLKDIPVERQPIAQGLYEELVFMQNTMKSLKVQVEADGAVSLYKNGKQEFLREHPALTAYNKTIQRYTQVYKQLIDLFPKVEGKSKDDELMEFLAK